MNLIKTQTFAKGDRNSYVKVGDLELYFSYQTLVAFRSPATGLKIRENEWGSTTGAHLNAIDNGEGERMNGRDFEIEVEKFLKTKGLL